MWTLKGKCWGRFYFPFISIFLANLDYFFIRFCNFFFDIITFDQVKQVKIKREYHPDSLDDKQETFLKKRNYSRVRGAC